MPRSDESNAYNLKHFHILFKFESEVKLCRKGVQNLHKDVLTLSRLNPARSANICIELTS